MRNILEKIAERTRLRIKEKKLSVPLGEVMEKARSLPVGDYPFINALKNGDIAFICEIKKASPSKGVIAEDFPYLSIAGEYEAAGAAAVSVLTEPYYFQGDDRFLKEISETVNIPLLRKDFVVDEYMLYEAKLLGADAVLLIAAILDGDILAEYIKTADSLGLSSLVETHGESEVVSALEAGARIIGVNNRDLTTFDVDVGLSERLRNLVPPGVVFVAESGIRTREDIIRLKKAGVDAVLIGETLMKSKDRKSELLSLMGVPVAFRNCVRRV
jgi:indole-3-glycerol phosphate synthase